MVGLPSLPSIATGQPAASPALPWPQTPGAKVHWYGKAGVTPGRKVGSSTAAAPAASLTGHTVRFCSQANPATAAAAIRRMCSSAFRLSPHVVPPHNLHSDIIDIMFRKRSAVLLGAQVGHITVTAPTALEARRRLAAIDPAAADALASSSSSASAHPPKVPPPVTLPRVHRTIICLCYSVSASIRSGS